VGVRDERDEKTWVVYELTSAGETCAADGQLEAHLRTILKTPKLEVFVPYLTFTYDSRVAFFNVMEGYCFVASGLDDRLYFSVVYDSPFLKSALHTKVGEHNRILMTVPDSKVQELRDKLAHMVAVEIQEGMRVRVTRGICQNLVGEVIGLDGDNAHVLISLRTLQSIRIIPRFALQPLGEEDE